MLSILNHLLKDRRVLTYVSGIITQCIRCLCAAVDALATADVWFVIGWKQKCGWVFFFFFSPLKKKKKTPLKSLSKTVHMKKPSACAYVPECVWVFFRSAFGDVKAVKWCTKPSLG